MTDIIEVPLASLSDEALTRLLEEYVTREGTDYGMVEYSLGEKVTQLKTCIQRGEAKIIFDLDTNCANIISTQ